MKVWNPALKEISTDVRVSGLLSLRNRLNSVCADIMHMTMNFNGRSWHTVTPTHGYGVSALISAGMKLSSIFVFVLLAMPSYAAINVYFSNSAPPSLQADLMASLTTQYQTTVTPGFFANTFTVTISSKQAAPVCAGTMPCQLDLDISAIIAVSTVNYVYGWANGQQYERNHDLSVIGNYVLNCSSVPYFHHISGSSATWDLGTCDDSLGTISNTIYQQNFSSPTVLTGF
jgi:hypothetical protein